MGRRLEAIHAPASVSTPAVIDKGIDMGILSCDKEQFLLDGEPYTVLSGAMHYFRIPRAYWYDRLLKLKECGFNTVETYVCWNLHEPREGEFDFSGNLDIAAYVQTAAELGLHVILRPGPYICAEWEFGGLPAWLLGYEKMRLRCGDPAFLSKVARYYAKLFDILRPHFAVNGGNIFMLQIENEYGAYGNDKSYLQAIADIYKDNQIDCLLFTSDGASPRMLSAGALENCFAVANFGSHVRESLAALKRFRPDQPMMCGEFWCGWFDHWFEAHHVRPADEVVKDFKTLLDMGANVNVYMFHGGTNFGFLNGANFSDKYEPTTTSYDYNAPLNEAGDRTELYYKLREEICARFGGVPALTARDSEKRAYGKLKLTQSAGLFAHLDELSAPVCSSAPLFMEDVGQDFGYLLYRTTVEPQTGGKLYFEQVHDRAQVFADGRLLGVLERWNRSAPELTLDAGSPMRLDVLVENMGRVNYGGKLKDDRKGLYGVQIDGQYLFNWQMYPLPMQDLSRLRFADSEELTAGPVFLRGSLYIEDAPRDTFLRLDGLCKGFVMVNGVNIGRYFNSAGPQRTLYVPAPFLRQGENEIIVFESDHVNSLFVEFVDQPELG